jgi:hypothetical protein
MAALEFFLMMPAPRFIRGGDITFLRTLPSRIHVDNWARTTAVPSVKTRSVLKRSHASDAAYVGLHQRAF